MLSVARSLVLGNPFRRIRRRGVAAVIFSYLLLLCLQMTLPLLLGSGYNYQPFWTFCSWRLDDIVSEDGLWYKLLFYLFMPVEFLLPAVPIIASSFATVWFLRDTTSRRDSIIERIKRKGSRSKVSPRPSVGHPPDMILRKSRATGTIILITIVYIVCNAPYWVLMLIYISSNKSFIHWLTSGGHYLNLFLSRTSVVINAGLNPLVYLLRVEELTRCSFIKTTYRRMIGQDRGHQQHSVLLGNSVVRASPITHVQNVKRSAPLSDVQENSSSSGIAEGVRQDSDIVLDVDQQRLSQESVESGLVNNVNVELIDKAEMQPLTVETDL